MGLNGLFEKLLARKWIAGEQIDDAIKEAKRLNSLRINAIINSLGERYTERELVEETVDLYLGLIAQIRRHKVMADISLKPTQLGLIIDKKLASENYTKIVNAAKRNDIFVWLDMEDYEYVENSIWLYETNVGKGMTGLCIQANVRRSADDLKRLSKRNATIRLVKGAHKGPESKMFNDRSKATVNYFKLMDYLFKRYKRFTIGTHDTALIEKAKELNKRYGRNVTYAMLKGIRENLARDMASSGHSVSVYIPFGEEWIPYSIRRLRERNNLKLILRSILSR